MQQDKILALVLRAPGQLKKPLRLSELLHDERHHPRARIADQMLQVVFNSRRGFIAGRNRIGKLDAVMAHVHGNHRRHRTALRNNCNSRRVAPLLRRSHDKSERNRVNVIHHSQAVWALDDHAVLARNARQLALRCFARLPGLGEPGGEDDQAANSFGGTGARGLHHGMAGYGQNRAVDAFGQFIN